jgi:hypothetical protein
LGLIYAVPRVRDAAAYLRATRLRTVRDVVDGTVNRAGARGCRPAITADSPCGAHHLPVGTLVDAALVVLPRRAEPAPAACIVSDRRGMSWVAGGSTRESETIRQIRVDLVRRFATVGRRSDRRGDVGRAVPAGAFRVDLSRLPAGVTRQGGRLIYLRSLGVAFNAFSYGLIE